MAAIESAKVNRSFNNTPLSRPDRYAIPHKVSEEGRRRNEMRRRAEILSEAQQLGEELLEVWEDD